MKKSKIINLVLVSATLSSCGHQAEKHERKVYMRSDSTADYTQTSYHAHGGGYYVFRPYGIFSGDSYRRAGYYSGAIHESSNIGRSSFKGATIRGGFGHSSFHVSS